MISRLVSFCCAHGQTDTVPRCAYTAHSSTRATLDRGIYAHLHQESIHKVLRSCNRACSISAATTDRKLRQARLASSARSFRDQESYVYKFHTLTECWPSFRTVCARSSAERLCALLVGINKPINEEYPHKITKHILNSTYVQLCTAARAV